MKKHFSALVAVSALSLGAAAFADDTKPTQSAHDHAGKVQDSSMHSKGSQELHKAMMEGMKDMHGMKMSGDTDRDFATMMIEHHEQAIAMSKAQLSNGKDPDVRRKAQEIIDTSQKDISELNKWRSRNVTSNSR
jgi:uncharacterized protein (DUF305 family)